LDIISDSSTILTPLTKGEQKEEREATLYTTPFAKNLDNAVHSPTKQTPTKKKYHENVLRGKKTINPIEVLKDINIIWQQTFKSYITLDFSDPLIKEKIASFKNILAKIT
jgi:hypothetical protein